MEHLYRLAVSPVVKVLNNFMILFYHLYHLGIYTKGYEILTSSKLILHNYVPVFLYL